MDRTYVTCIPSGPEEVILYAGQDKIAAVNIQPKNTLFYDGEAYVRVFQDGIEIGVIVRGEFRNNDKSTLSKKVNKINEGKLDAT
ncbi:hypothetical protein [Paenibacillus macquariensis]|uniref:DUF2283 domain-containing protein n=1 Tax=Paenibacillus macquariensis TaxID=948756 RepID=A0ABY1KH75_9BACL|nr:hypothetical protein [Paenibacillus macquariensis]OAB35442.1 hypothetical protein PMSM_09300 [Paenibacillus macquariensis subsp. macquariensis]SIR74582.1 hypothetical protein SAMN05421578_1619 [Paenibacillus macquariensis]